MVLLPIGASSVQEDNFLVALAALLIEDVSSSLERNSSTLRQMLSRISQTPVRLVAITILEIPSCWMLMPNPEIPFAYLRY